MDILVPRALVSDSRAFGGVISGDCLRGVPVIRNNHLMRLDPPAGKAVQMVLPRLVEAHCHLDKCHTIHRLHEVGGDLARAIEQQRADKANWTASDIRTRARRGIADARANGCAVVRTHVDWGETVAPPLAWSVLSETAADMKGLQLSALIGIGQWADPAFARAAGALIARQGGVAGAFVMGHDTTRDGLTQIFDVAIRHGLMLDFHVDEGLGYLNGLEAIADTAIATGFQAPILCGHAISLMDRDPGNFGRIAAKLAQARITVCALPTTNLYLQGRTDGTPDRRGITRLRELRSAGVPVSVGSDNVGDAFCPLGAHDPMAALALACMTAHLDPPLGDWLPTITTDAAAALGVPQTWVDGAMLDELLSCGVSHTADLVAARAPLQPASETLG